MHEQIDLSQLVSAHGNSAIVELSFDPICFVKFLSLLLVFLFIPFLSLAKLFTNQTYSRRKPINKRKTFSVNYVPSKQEPFVPLKTRKHFRISHIGNKVSYDSSSEEDEDEDEANKIEYKLVWGKRRRGEESEFKGRSAMKGGREIERQKNLMNPSSSITIKSNRSVSISSHYVHPSVSLFRSTSLSLVKSSQKHFNSDYSFTKRITGNP
ncbi:hypothetical protein CROQUDRAFT_656472 [Cronartium quercuum f. sp. fusiforme G11]|uniref:Uncharacterized protein n=1 Tax=Cronartium quercuum f. sp. fusiforme G11 TaxID=708437 RepID=A0A9P6NN46_9BASI|nr:hypothetical protein CROQUDRAFT_656472 [Cronartium quercuum f. sp. fusiforme G11]